jgi:hypothetical protein
MPLRLPLHRLGFLDSPPLSPFAQIVPISQGPVHSVLLIPLLIGTGTVISEALAPFGVHLDFSEHVLLHGFTSNHRHSLNIGV